MFYYKCQYLYVYLCMKSSPRVSIIMPFFNSPHFASALQSVKDQTYTDWEAFVVNDFIWQGPICENIAQELKNNLMQDSRFTLITNEKNIWVSQVRKNAINNTAWELVAFLDHDDIWLPDKIEKQVDFLDKNPDVWVLWTNAIWIDGESRVIKHQKMWETDEDLRKIALFNCPCRHSSTIIRRDILNMLPDMPDWYKGADDYRLLLQSSKYTKMHNLQDFLIYYRWTDDNMSNTYVKRTFRESFDIIKNSWTHLNLYIPALFLAWSKLLLSDQMAKDLRMQYHKILEYIRKLKTSRESLA